MSSSCGCRRCVSVATTFSSLARQFADEFAGGPMRLSPQAVQCLLTHGWSGNVRDLRNAVQRACLLCRGDIIMPEHLPPEGRRP